MKKLAGELAGQPVVFLEYYAGSSEGSRESRFLAAFGGFGYSVPMAIVGSGYRFSQGPVDFYNVFKGMIQADRSRPPEVDLESWWWKAGPTTLRIYATVHNSSAIVLDNATNEAGVWGLACEHKATLGLTGMFTRAAVRTPLTPALPPGASGSVIVDLTINYFVDWASVHPVVAVELRPGGTTGPYDMLQADLPRPAELTVVPSSVHLAVPQGPGSAALELAGPHVLSWTAVADAPWLVLTPSEGSVATPTRVEVQAGLLQPGEQSGSITFTATAPDGLGVTTVLPVTATLDPDFARPSGQPRRKLLRRSPGSGGS